MTDSGAYQTRVYGRAVNVKDADGRWAAIDNELRRSGDGFVNGLGSYDLTLPSTLDGAVELVDGASKLSLTLQGSGAAASVDGSTATYAGAGTGVDARWTAFNEAVKEDLILKGPDSQTSFTYDLELSEGLQAKARRDGGVDIVDASGDIAFAIPAAVAVDAKGAVAPASASSIVVDGDELTISLDPEWVKEEGRAFPVTLDPSVGTGAARDCFVDQLDSTTNFCSSGELWAGRTGAGHNHNALLNFNLAGVVPAAAFVQSAEVGVYPLYQTNPGTAKTLHLRKPTADWDNNATWIKRTASANWTTPGGDLAATSESTLPVPGSGQWSWFPVTNLVNSWIDGSEPNRGVAITDAGSTADNTVVYASRDWADSNAWPYLDIEYFSRAGQMAKYTIDTQKITDRSSVGVNVAGGNLMVSSSDLNVDAKGLPVSVGRTFNSQDVWDGQMGYRGRLSVGRDIAIYDCDQLGSKCLVGPSGFRARFAKKPDGSFETPPNVGNLTLARATPTSGRYTLTDNESGTKWGFFDNGFSFADQITDRHGNQVNFQFYGPNGALSKITDANGREYPVTANSDGFITKIEVPSAQFAGGVAWNYGYNANGDLTSVTDPENKTTTYTYTGGALTKITDPRLNETLITYDSLDRVTSVTRKVDGTVANDVKTTYSYPAVDSVCDLGAAEGGLSKIAGKTIATDANNRATTYCWDNGGGVRKAINALGQQTDTKFAASTGNVEGFTSFAGTGNANAATAITYGGSGSSATSSYNMTGTKAPAGEQMSMTYRPASSDPLEQYRLETATDEQGKTTKLSYTGGNVTKVDSLNSGGTAVKSTNLSWNTDGTLAWSKDGNNNQTSYLYDSLGRLSEVTPPNFSITGRTKYTYDGLSRVKTMEDGRGKITTYTYDKLDRQKTVTDADGVLHSMTFDANGNLTGRSGPSQTSSYTYDKLNRRTAETIIGTTNTYTYDKVGNLTSVNDAGAPGAVTYTYDEINRVKTITSPLASGSGNDATPTSFVYTDPTAGAAATDPAVKGYVTQTLPGGGSIRTESNLSGKTTQILVKDNTGTQRLKREYKYQTYGTSTGQHALLDWATEQAGSSGAVTNKIYSYDDSGQLTDAQTLDASFTQTAKDSFDYDGAGNRKHRVRVVGSSTSYTSYAYNSNNELCWMTSTNVASPTCGAGAAPGAAPPSGSTQFTFDLAGNQLTQTGASSLAWDAKSTLKTIGTDTVTTLSPNNTELAGIGTSVFKNTLLGVSRLTVAGNTSIIHRNPDDGTAVSQNRDSQKRWFVTDNLGSTIALVEGNGNITRTYSYDVDGNVTNGIATGPDTWIKYVGAHDIGNGLYHMGSRYYQPGTGRWTQEDPLLQASSLGQSNRYSYVAGNPINYTDPGGESLKSVVKGAGRVLKKTAEEAAGGAVDGLAVGIITGHPVEGLVTGAIAGAGEGAAVGVVSEIDKDAGEDLDKGLEVVGQVRGYAEAGKGAIKRLRK